LENKVIFMYK